jgi:hypothetical protein
LQKLCALSSQNAATHCNVVIERGVVQNMQGAMYSSGFGVLGTLYQCRDTGVHHGSRAHRAWLDEYKEIALYHRRFLTAEPSARRRFRAGSWVGIGQIAVESASDDFAFMHLRLRLPAPLYIERSLSRPQGLRIHNSSSSELPLFRTNNIV